MRCIKMRKNDETDRKTKVKSIMQQPKYLSRTMEISPW